MTDKNTKKSKANTPLRTSIHSIFATDNALEEEGSWVEVNPITKLSIKVRRTNSDTVVKAADRIVREWVTDGTIREGETPEDGQMDKLRRIQFADVVLVDWKNLKDLDTGKDISYDRDTAYELLGVKDFIDFVAQAASERDTFRSKVVKAAEGN